MVSFLGKGYTPFAQARRALSIASLCTSILVIPLGVSFFDLVKHSRLEASLKQALLNRTVTFQRVELVGIKTNWLAKPPQVQLTVRSHQPVTPRQVRLLEEFLEREMEQPFDLIFEVSQIQKVRRESN